MKKEKKEINKILQYNRQISLIECYVTKNICSLVKNEKELEFIKNNIFLLGITNKLGKNSLNILLENSDFLILKQLINYDVRILRLKNRNEKNLLMSLISYEQFYLLINKILTSKTNKIIDNYYQFKIKILSEPDINGNTFIDLCIELIKLNLESDVNKLIPIIKILKTIYEMDKEEVFLVITKLCRDISNETLLLKILEYINPKNLDIYPDFENNTCIDYLILEEKYKILNYLIDRIEHIYFVNFEENSVLLLLDNLDSDDVKTSDIIELIFKILSKSNINKLKDMYNENIMFKLLNLFKLNKTTLKKFIQYFDIFEQNIEGEHIYNLLVGNYPSTITHILDNKYIVDSQISYVKIDSIDIIPVNFNFNIKHFLRQTNYGVFISDSLHNMIYTYIILERNNLLIPFIHESSTTYKNNLDLITMSNNDKDILGIIKFYFHNFNSWLPHLIIWKDKTNYFIYSELITWLKNNTKSKRFIYIKLSIIATNKLQGNIRHANLILIDNLKQTVERFEPYGEIYFSNCAELNFMLEHEIANNLGYKFVFIQSYPGFQIRSDEFEEKNKSYGDPGGYCLAWCFLYLELKLYYENITLEKLRLTIKDEVLLNELKNSSDLVIKLINNYIINNFENDFPNLKTDVQQNLYMGFIRYYAKNLDKSKNKLIKKYGLNISTIYHLNLDDKIHKKIIYNLNRDIESINKINNNL
jgi:hypothetical protein